MIEVTAGSRGGAMIPFAMDWIGLVLASLVVWGLCGAVMAIGRRFWGLAVALTVHLVAAPVFAFAAGAAHEAMFRGFDPLTRAGVMVAIVIALDAGVVAPFMERSYAMFRSAIGTWIPFGLIFLASWAAALVA